MREVTERPEGVEAGTSVLVGTSKEKIISEVSKLINNSEYYEQVAKISNPYGDGKSSRLIYNFLGDKIGRH